jgi:hypothetical protein
MRVAALYDIHGNLPALEAVLEDVRRAGVDEIVVGGDVFPGPMAMEALSLLDGLTVPTRFIKGNGDRVVLAARSGSDISEVPAAYRDVIEWGAEGLDDDAARKVSAWESRLRQGPAVELRRTDHDAQRAAARIRRTKSIVIEDERPTEATPGTCASRSATLSNARTVSCGSPMRSAGIAMTKVWTSSGWVNPGSTCRIATSVRIISPETMSSV